MLSVMTQRVIIGVDPGPRETGIVRRTVTDLLGWTVHRRPDGPLLPTPADLDDLVRLIRGRFLHPGDTIAVEDIVKPSPFINGRRSFVEPLSYAATGAIYGAIAAAFPGIVVAVRPRKAGGLPPRAYPEAIRPRPGGKGSDMKRHCRAAWDVAGQA